MTNDTEKCHGWTVSTLFTHLSALLGAQEKAVKVAQDGADRALLKAESADRIETLKPWQINSEP